MEQNLQTPTTNGNGNGHLVATKKSRSIKTDSLHNGHISTFDPNKYMLKLPKTKKVSKLNGQVRFERTESLYLPVAARIAWFRKDHPLWRIITEVEQLADKAVVMKATVRDILGTVIATARKKETESVFQITSKKPRQAQSVGH